MVYLKWDGMQEKMTKKIEQMIDSWQKEDAAKDREIESLRTQLAEARAEVERLYQEAIEDAVVIGRLNGGEELQTLMKMNNELVSRATAAEAALRDVVAAADPPLTDGVWAGTAAEAVEAMKAERDELAAQLAVTAEEILRMRGPSRDLVAEEMHARAKALMDVVKVLQKAQAVHQEYGRPGEPNQVGITFAAEIDTDKCLDAIDAVRALAQINQKEQR